MDSIPQIEAMRMGVDYHALISLRGFSILVRPLALSESVEIASEVVADLQRMPEAFRNSLTEHSLLAKRTLVKATTSDVGTRDPKLTELILDRCTGEEVQYLYKQYVDVVEKVNPSMESLTKEQISELVGEVKKNASALTGLSRSQLCSLVSALLTNDE